MTHLPESLIRPVRRVALAPALLAAALCGAPAAQAGEPSFALTCIGTETGSTIRFMYRWGRSGEWQSATIEPGRWALIRYSYSRSATGDAPPLFIRYDDDLSDGINLVRQEVRSYAARRAHCESEGYTYNFRARNGELFLDDEESSGSVGAGARI